MINPHLKALAARLTPKIIDDLAKARKERAVPDDKTYQELQEVLEKHSGPPHYM